MWTVTFSERNQNFLWTTLIIILWIDKIDTIKFCFYVVGGCFLLAVVNEMHLNLGFKKYYCAWFHSL